MLDNGAHKRLRLCQAPTTWAWNPVHPEKISDFHRSVASCSKLEWEMILYSFWSFLKGRGAMSRSKKHQKPRFEQCVLVQNSLTLLTPNYLKRIRRMQDQLCPTNFSLTALRFNLSWWVKVLRIGLISESDWNHWTMASEQLPLARLLCS